MTDLTPLINTIYVYVTKASYPDKEIIADMLRPYITPPPMPQLAMFDERAAAITRIASFDTNSVTELRNSTSDVL